MHKVEKILANSQKRSLLQKVRRCNLQERNKKMTKEIKNTKQINAKKKIELYKKKEVYGGFCHGKY